MNPIERKGLLYKTCSNLVSVEPALIEEGQVQTADCVYSVISMAVNTLTESSHKVTGLQVQRAAEAAKLRKGQFNKILNELARQYGITDVQMVTLFDSPLNKDEEFKLYAYLIDKKCLIFAGVDGIAWCQMMKFPEETLERAVDKKHALLINGYEIKKNLLMRKQFKSLFGRDPNLKKQISIPFDSLHGIIIPALRNNYIFFRNKNNPI